MGNSKTKLKQTISENSSCDDISKSGEPSPSTSNLYPQLQIRNCVRNVRNTDGSNFADVLPTNGPVNGQSSVYTIDIHQNGLSSNAVYPSLAKPTSNDGLPTYEEAIGGAKSPNASITIPIETPVAESTSSSRHGHRHRRHHRRHRNRSRADEVGEDPIAEGENDNRRRHRRGFRLKKHLAKMRRQRSPETE